ncbi:MAG TPA: MFS transporter [Pirellulaceae bacterium]|nr:MFS transporter [Pirellulaceae bacterium]
MQPADKPTNVRWVVFSLACGTSWLLYLHRYSFALFKPELVKQWELSKTELGLLDGAFSIGSIGFQIPFGVAADAVGVRLVLTCLLVLGSVGLGMHAWAPSPKYLWPARLVFGIGQSAVYACLSRIAQTWFPPRIRTALQSTAAITFGRLGGLTANLILGGVVLGLYGVDWRVATNVMAAGGVIFAIAVALVFRNSPREQPLANEAEADLIDPPQAATADTPPRMSVSQMLRSLRPAAVPNFVWLNVQTILSTFADNIYSHWIPLFLWEVHQLKFGPLGLYSSLPLLGGAIAGILGGMLNDGCIAASGNRRWSRRVVAICGKGLAAVLLLAALAWYHNPYVFCWFLFAVKFFGDWSLATSWGVVTDIGGRATASVFAVNNTVAGIGLFAAPIVFGFVADHWGWPAVFVAVAVAYILCALSWLGIDSTQPLLDDRKPLSPGPQAGQIGQVG